MNARSGDVSPARCFFVTRCNHLGTVEGLVPKDDLGSVTMADWTASPLRTPSKGRIPLHAFRHRRRHV